MNTYRNGSVVRYSVAVALLLGFSSIPTFVYAQKPPVSGDLPFVTLGGQTITDKQYDVQLKATASKELIRKMVFTSLVRQAAVKAGVMPTERDVDTRIRELSFRQPAITQQAAYPSVRADLKTDLALENLRIRGITVSDAQVAGFYTHHAALFTKPSQVQTTMVVSNKRSNAGLAEKLLGQGAAPEAIAAKPGLHVAGLNGFNVNMGALSTGVRQTVGKTVLAMKPGQVKTIPIPGNTFLTFKVKNAHGNVLPPLSQIRDQVTRQAKLQKAVSPQQELATLYRATPPRFNDPKYKAYFSDVEHYYSRP